MTHMPLLTHREASCLNDVTEAVTMTTRMFHTKKPGRRLALPDTEKVGICHVLSFSDFCVSEWLIDRCECSLKTVN